MNTKELLEIHKHILDYYLHEHTLSWHLIGIGWATNVGILSALLLTLDLKTPRTPLEIGFCALGLITNLVWWLALERNQVYKDSLTYEGRKIERELAQIGLSVCVFETRETIREKKQHPAEHRRLCIREQVASTTTSRYSFLLLIIPWAILLAYV
jgi:hypothetical protein